MSWQSRMTKAKSTLVDMSPFFGSIALQIPSIIEPEVDTMATDGESLLVNVEYIDSLSDDELVGVLAHEIMHVSLNHHTRMGSRDLEQWNIACDYVINGELIKQKFVLPKGVLIDKAFDGMSAEDAYHALSKKKDKQNQNQSGSNSGNQQQKAGQQSQSGNQSGNQQGKTGNSGNGNSGKGSMPDPGKCGGIIKPKDIEKAKAEQSIKNNQAATFAAQANAGNMPDFVKRLLGQSKPVSDWRQILQRFISQCNNLDYSFSKPNKNYLPFDMIMPSLVPNGINRLVCVVDTSGSIDVNTLNTFAAEMQDAANAIAIDEINVIYCDARVHNVETFCRGDELKLNPIGGGGTDFAPAMAYIAEQYQDAAAIIYFTDLVCYSFGKEPDCPVLWAAYGNAAMLDRYEKTVPYGETMRITDY